MPSTQTGNGVQSASPRPAGPARTAVQGPIGGFTGPLADTEFVVVDLETTGGSPEHAVIMEIGAVRVRGRQRAADEAVFGSLVNPGRPIPAHISALTGITDHLVSGAPRIGQVLPAFLRFAAGAVVVAHNAPFDLAFLGAACQREGLAWPAVPVLDTAGLARRVLTTEEAPDCRLATLARMFGTSAPGHRALDDARATALVLRGLIGRLAALGVHTLHGVSEITDEDAGYPAGPRRERMLELTADIPAAPGVCLFLGPAGEVLHVVKSSDMRARVRGYFAVSETRAHIRELLEHTERLCPVTRPTALAADVEEIRAITRHRPRYNEGPPSRAEAAPIPPEIAALAGARRVVASGPRFDGGWDLAVIEHGLLAASAPVPGTGPPVPGTGPAVPGNGPTALGTDARLPGPYALPPGSEALPPGSGALPPGAGEVPSAAGESVACGSAAERACVLRWLGSPGVRVIETDP